MYYYLFQTHKTFKLRNVLIIASLTALEMFVVTIYDVPIHRRSMSCQILVKERKCLMVENEATRLDQYKRNNAR